MTSGPPFEPAPARRDPRRREILIGAAAALIALIVLSQGIATPLQKGLEPRSAQWIQNVVSQGNWLLPRSYYGKLCRKPPLFYWLAAGATLATGGRVDEVRARVVSLAAAAALAVLVLMWTRHHIGAAAGWLAFFFLIGSYGYASRAVTALTDMLMTSLMFAAYCLMMPMVDGDVSRARIVAVGLLLGLGVLTKGPVVIVLAGLGAAAYLALTRRNPLVALAQGWPWAVLALAIAMGAVWYAPAIALGGGTVLEIIFDENLGHFLPAGYGGTGEVARPFYHVPWRLFQGAMPLSLLAPALIAMSWTGALNAREPRALSYQAALVLAVAAFFTVASVRRDDYILPALPGFAILLGAMFARTGALGTSAQRLAARLRDVTVLAIAGAVAAAVVGAFVALRAPDTVELVAPRLHESDALLLAAMHDAARQLDARLILFAASIVAGGAIAIGGVLRRRAPWSGAGLSMLALSASLMWMTVLRDGAARLRAYKPFVAEVRARTGGAPLFTFGRDKEEITFYYGKAVRELIRRDGSVNQSAETVYLIATPAELAKLPAEHRARLRLIRQSSLRHRGGSPALFALEPAPAAAEPRVADDPGG